MRFVDDIALITENEKDLDKVVKILGKSFIQTWS